VAALCLPEECECHIEAPPNHVLDFLLRNMGTPCWVTIQVENRARESERERDESERERERDESECVCEEGGRGMRRE
jgi:hypothetical protein